ncbi:hypothetical protein QR680_015711 [Steinernema hermaphroditum]|uniref:Uncharacterized protein n=1 Tax=Steinernema hermaphroditum TaxID=289476 RepID=A0AA39H8Q2_9BILA|nr:hypothetical protein QR680_015711 [Steinernema hermaphroditum]
MNSKVINEASGRNGTYVLDQRRPKLKNMTGSAKFDDAPSPIKSRAAGNKETGIPTQGRLPLKGRRWAESLRTSYSPSQPGHQVGSTFAYFDSPLREYPYLSSRSIGYTTGTYLNP